VPDVLDRSEIDEINTLSNETALATGRKCAKLEGMPAGISSAGTTAATLEVGKRPEMKRKQIVVVAASSAER
jgi:cysteine synthase